VDSRLLIAGLTALREGVLPAALIRGSFEAILRNMHGKVAQQSNGLATLELLRQDSELADTLASFGPQVTADIVELALRAKEMDRVTWASAVMSAPSIAALLPGE